MALLTRSQAEREGGRNGMDSHLSGPPFCSETSQVGSDYQHGGAEDSGAALRAGDASDDGELLERERLMQCRNTPCTSLSRA